MARYIDAEKAVEEARLSYCKDCDSYNGVKCRACGFDDAMMYIEDAPEADVVEVVRCKDCIWFQPEFVQTPNGERRPYTEEELKNGRIVTMDVGINCGSRCERYERWEENSIPVWCHEDDFCSYGKRKKAD